MVTNGSSGSAHIFVSHSTSDKALADGLTNAIEGLCPGRIDVYHSSRDGSRGVSAGDEWFKWILREVRQADVTIVLLTPASLERPWLMWETGAVCGAAESFAEPDSNRPLWPLLVDVRPEKLPTPLQAMGRQVRRGETPEEFRRLLEDLLDYLGELNRLVASDQRSAVALIDHSVQRFDREVLEWRRQADTGPTESAILEWCSRLDGLFNSGQYRDVNQFHRWFNITLHRSEDKPGEALDQRIHRRLGELYLASGQAVPAAKEFGLAVSLAPRDIYLLRCLGQAQLDSKNVQATKECLDEIERLDPQAFSENVDCAALKGRYLRSIALYEQARDAYLEASRMNPRSFYLRDLLGQAHLAIPDFDEAETEYREALRIISTSGDRTLWAHATAAAAHLVLNQLDELEHELEQIGDLNPSPGKREKIVASLQDINNRLLPDKQVLNAVLDRRRRVLPAH